MMKLNVLEDKKDSMVFELQGEQHTFPALLCWALLQDDDVEVAVYDLHHPLVGQPHIHLKVKKGEPREALKKALKKIKGELSDLEKGIGKK